MTSRLVSTHSSVRGANMSNARCLERVCCVIESIRIAFDVFCNASNITRRTSRGVLGGRTRRLYARPCVGRSSIAAREHHRQHIWMDVERVHYERRLHSGGRPVAETWSSSVQLRRAQRDKTDAVLKLRPTTRGFVPGDSTVQVLCICVTLPVTPIRYDMHPYSTPGQKLQRFQQLLIAASCGLRVGVFIP